MADMLPFKALRFNPKYAPDIREVICPPYDVIDAAAQADYYKKHENNIIRIELGKEAATDGPDENRYTRAARFLAEWIDKGILKKDPDPSFYLYELEYSLPKTGKKTLTGFFGRVKLEEIGKGNIFPHEFTFPKAKKDRLELMRACRANTSPIFMLYADKKGEVIHPLTEAAQKTAPQNNFDWEAGIHHKLWKISDPAAVEAVSKNLSGLPLFIADGHHRYETALNYKNEMNEKEPGTGDQPHDSVMVFCANMDDAGMSLLPIHRVILNPLPIEKAEMDKRLGDLFERSEYPFGDSEPAARERLFEAMASRAGDRTVFGMYARNEKVYHLLTLKKEAAPKIEKTLDGLDSSLFQKIILEQVFEISNLAEQKEKQVQFKKGDEPAVEMVRKGTAGLAFFLNPVRIDQFREVVLSGERMPQKTTFFYPKPVTGLVINKF
ncbi:MAG TPA: DUF1015 domain-containing protein [Nitrospiria bacterium]